MKHLWVSLVQFFQSFFSLELKSFYKFLENIPFEIAIYDRKGNYEFINSHYFTANVPRSDLIGKDDLFLFKSGRLDSSSLENRLHHFQQVVRSKKTIRFTESIQFKDSDKINYFKRVFVPLLNPRTGEVNKVASYGNNLTAVILSQKELKFLAYHDKLTGIGNRDAFNLQLEQLIFEASRQGDQSISALLFCDLDNFKLVNDSLGHDIGDLVLIEAANRMKFNLRKSDQIFRLGGDEFVIILKNIRQEYDAAIVAEKLLRVLSQPFEIKQHYINYLSSSIGIALYPKDGKDRKTLLVNADAAMYVAKKKSKNSFQYYSEEMTDASTKRLNVVKNLKKLVNEEKYPDQFHMVYQPIVEKSSNGDFYIIGSEALLRWNSPELGQVSPGYFIPIAEETNLIHPMGKWIIQKSVEDFKSLTSKYQTNGFYVSVNFSTKQLKSPELVSRLKYLVDYSGIPASKLQIEITETSLLENDKLVMRNIQALTDMGFKLALDDFGTGYASLIYLQKIPADTIKIDRSFIRRIKNENDRTLLKSILLLGQNLNKKIIAEGVEDLNHLEFLLDNGCFQYQGFLFSRPVALKELEKLINGQVLPGPTILK